MKTILVFIAFFGVVLFACEDKDDASFEAVGQITGPDLRECACCGGWFLETVDTTFLFDRLPDDSKIDLSNATFPIAVEFEYDREIGGCGEILNRIIITEIELK